MRSRQWIGFASALAFGCAGESTGHKPQPASAPAIAPALAPAPEPTPPAARIAVATMAPTEGNQVTGTVTFAEAPDGVAITATISGLSPGEHGFHIHENGDCSAPDGTSAGGHFNPTGASHGAPDAPVHHGGDLGNLSADATGSATKNLSSKSVTVSAGDRSVVGRAVIIHASGDDMTTQPTGAAGARVACGVIALK